MQYKRGGHIYSWIVELFREYSNKKRRRSAAYLGGTPFLRSDHPSDIFALLEPSSVIFEADESLLGASSESIFLYSASRSFTVGSETGGVENTFLTQSSTI